MVKDKHREAFIEENLALVHSLCKRFSGRGIEYDDLYQAGCVGLVKAADGFDASRGFCFSTYAVPVVLGEIRRLFRDGGTVKVSRGLKELSLKISRARTALELTLAREPTVSELAEYLGVTPEDITEAISSAQPVVSLTYENDDGSCELQLPCCNMGEDLENKLLLDRALSQLDKTEQSIIRYRYYGSLTQSETANLLSMSQVQVSRAEKKILLKLRNIIG